MDPTFSLSYVHKLFTLSTRKPNSVDTSNATKSCKILLQPRLSNFHASLRHGHARHFIKHWIIYQEELRYYIAGVGKSLPFSLNIYEDKLLEKALEDRDGIIVNVTNKTIIFQESWNCSLILHLISHAVELSVGYYSTLRSNIWLKITPAYKYFIAMFIHVYA